MGVIENLVSFVFVLGVMVLIHELGHFLAARYFDVRVEAFSIGFGPRLFGFKRGDTDYKVCLFPLGGYVKMAGENIGEPTGDPGEFMSKPRWQPSSFPMSTTRSYWASTPSGRPPRIACSSFRLSR